MGKRKMNHSKIQINSCRTSDIEKNVRKLRPMRGSILDPYLAEVLGWARDEKGSKSWVENKVKSKFKINVSRDQIYRFVKKHNDGVWPNSRKNEGRK